MAKLLLHGSDARRALAKGVAQLAASVEPTLGPKGLNAMVDRPIGTPIVTRDGVSIAGEIELSDRFENMGAQVVREVSMQTNEVAGDGTTTAMVLANALIQKGVNINDGKVRPVDLCKGIDIAVQLVVDELLQSARSCDEHPEYLTAVATVAATDPKLGAMVAEAYHRVGKEGVISADYSVTVNTTLDVVEGMSFERGYLSHHMVTNEEKMEAVLENPLILMTDHKILDPSHLAKAREIAQGEGRPLLIIAEEIAPSVVVSLMDDDGVGKYLIVHPPEYGHWRTAMMDDLAILTGGEVVARDLGKTIDNITLKQLGGAERVIASSSFTSIVRGNGDSAAIKARKAQVQRQHDASPPNINQDKLRERLSKLSGGMAVISVGGFTPVEQKRKIQLIEDSLCAVQAAAEDGVVAGGGTALAQIGHKLEEVSADNEGDVRTGIELLCSVLTRPLERIAFNAGADADAVKADVLASNSGRGYDASIGEYNDMFKAGIIDPVRVTTSALVNAASVATLILTTETLIADLAEGEADPTAGPALGGGAELLGRP
ncbi:molecular chaperone GroEL [Granulosicoccus antarcticus]|uniref:60 kDa chaperonin n=1 Tax=Granulosicoccus antarcticus IMCC3135 TaxID=1192854 RepID=A0A2Z2NUC9_9GAMM|nr:molecular chaperone GroEL [Granulosicoccus antarcticus]ASJ74853.1 60 kDa chaperonin [Granulosicoccus antarcticus IMCC3135]